MDDLVKVTRTIRGPRDQVSNVLEAADQRGRLVSATGVRFLPGDRIEITAVLLTERSTAVEPASRFQPRRPGPTMVPWFRRRPKLAATMLIMSLGLVAFFGWIAYQIVELVIANFAAVLFVAILILALALIPGHAATKAAGCCPCHRR